MTAPRRPIAGPILGALILIGLLCTSGCYRHRQGVADSAASIVELSLAVEHRPDLAPVLVPPIRKAAMTIIAAQGATYTPTVQPPKD